MMLEPPDEAEPEACYAGLPPATMHSLEQRARRIKGIAARSALDIGLELAEARREIAAAGAAGGFQAWVRAKIGITEQYASQLIAVSEQF